MSERTPGAVLLHPLVLAALATWLINDHLLKTAYPGLLSGKLSDVASLIVCPLLLYAAVDLRWPQLAPSTRRAVLLFAVALVGAIMIGVKLDDAAAFGYRWGLGLLQWPFQALHSMLALQPLPSLRPVRLAMDPTDLLTLPSLLVPALLGWATAVPAVTVAATTAPSGPVR